MKEREPWKIESNPLLPAGQLRLSNPDHLTMLALYEELYGQALAALSKCRAAHRGRSRQGYCRCLRHLPDYIIYEAATALRNAEAPEKFSIRQYAWNRSHTVNQLSTVSTGNEARA